MDEDSAPGSERNDESPPPDPEPDPAPLEPPVHRPPRFRSAQVARPWEALERLDRQWVDPMPLEKLPGPVTALAMTTLEDPEGWDYLTAMTGALPGEVAAACEAWLEAQLAADATLVGRSHRPTVELVPAGRLWYVVRAVADFIFVVDGPGFLTPLAAAIAASRRYEAELLRDLEQDSQRDDSAAAAEAERAAESRPSQSTSDTKETDAPSNPDDPASRDAEGQ